MITTDWTQLGYCNPSFGIVTSVSWALPFSTDSVRSLRLAILDHRSQNLSFLSLLQMTRAVKSCVGDSILTPE